MLMTSIEQHERDGEEAIHGLHLLSLSGEPVPDLCHLSYKRIEAHSRIDKLADCEIPPSCLSAYNPCVAASADYGQPYQGDHGIPLVQYTPLPYDRLASKIIIMF